MNKCFKLFASCIPVRGVSRSTICDVQRGEIRFIPNSLCDLLLEFDGANKAEIIQAKGEKHEQVINEYFDFLIEHEFGFWTSIPDQFPRLDSTWDSPTLIANGIVDSDRFSTHNWATIFKAYEQVGCKHLQLRFFDDVDFDFLNKTLSLLHKSSINSIELVLKYSESISLQKLQELLNNVLRIASISIHSCPKDFKVPQIQQLPAQSIHFHAEEISSHSHCGNINKGSFIINQETFLESLNFNTCLNKKVSIASNGDIKNCPSMRSTFGNINTHSLLDSIHLPGFKKTWTIRKDQIETCKGCEFRHICTDCRAYLSADYSFEKPKKCSYNPKTMKWEDNIPRPEFANAKSM